MTQVVSAAPLTRRYDFVLLFDVTNGNPNGDPDAGNAPRVDPETGHGLVSDVSLKRKIRDFVAMVKRESATGNPVPGYDIYVKLQAVLEQAHRDAYSAAGLKAEEKDKAKKLDNVQRARAWMCQHFFDVRAFGAVMSLKGSEEGARYNCGQVRGAAQLTFARSVDPITALEQAIIRKAVATQREAHEQVEKHGQVTGTMGRKEIIPYALYRGHGFVNPHFAAQTGFSEEDLNLLWDALRGMFEVDHSAARGEMVTRGIFIFEHESSIGNAPAHRLFERIQVKLKDPSKPPRSFADYDVVVADEKLPAGVKMYRREA